MLSVASRHLVRGKPVKIVKPVTDVKPVTVFKADMVYEGNRESFLESAYYSRLSTSAEKPFE